jgi:hypothetical protein
MNVFVITMGNALRAQWRDLRPITRVIEVSPLDDNDARQCVDRYAQEYLQTPLSFFRERTDRQVFGLPLGDFYVNGSSFKTRVRDFSVVDGEVIDDLVDTLASESAEMKLALEICSVLRWFNEDILNYI